MYFVLVIYTMDNIISEARSLNQNTFLNHVFDTSEEGKAEILNVVQYAVTGILPIVALNKTIQKFIPEADIEKSSLEVLAEIFIQIVVMFIGIVLIHRLITYFPTYSGYKYEAFNLTTVILAFLVIVLSLQTKLGIKVNILVDRALELWNGPSKEVVKKDSKRPCFLPSLFVGFLSCIVKRCYKFFTHSIVSAIAKHSTVDIVICVSQFTVFPTIYPWPIGNASFVSFVCFFIFHNKKMTGISPRPSYAVTSKVNVFGSSIDTTINSTSLYLNTSPLDAVSRNVPTFD